MSSQNVSIGLTSNTRDVISESNGTNRREIKKELKSKLSEMLSKGEITKQEMKDALKYCDKDLQRALAGKNSYEKNNELMQIDDPKDRKLLDETGLCIDDLFAASRLAGSDFTINAASLSKEENNPVAMNSEGEFTRSELVNIQNELNSRIKANGSDKVLTEKETIRLMQAIGLQDGTRKTSTLKAALTGLVVPLNIVNAIITASSHGEKNFVERKIEEQPFGNQDNSIYGSVTNKTEAKMNELFQQKVIESGSQDTELF